jgi:hypothetical protein
MLDFGVLNIADSFFDGGIKDPGRFSDSSFHKAGIFSKRS